MSTAQSETDGGGPDIPSPAGGRRYAAGVKAFFLIALLGPPLGGIMLAVVASAWMLAGMHGGMDLLKVPLLLLSTFFLFAAASYAVAGVTAVLAGITAGLRIAFGGQLPLWEMALLSAVLAAGMPFLNGIVFNRPASNYAEGGVYLVILAFAVLNFASALILRRLMLRMEILMPPPQPAGSVCETREPS
jgi:hypothetical protein